MSNMNGRVCVVTGATQGIGKVTALELARQGAEVALVVRSADRGQSVAEEIRSATGRTAAVFVADLALMAEVRRVAHELAARYPKIHVLVNNAGAIHNSRKVTAEGLEMTFATNHLASFILTEELLPNLVAAAEPGRTARIVNVASNAHRKGQLDLDDLMFERKRYAPMRVYQTSKLANVFFTYELARRLTDKPVTANCLHPGVIATGFGRNDRSLLHLGIRIAAPFMLTPAKGARTTIYLATAAEVEGVTGKYFAKCKPLRSRASSYDEGIAKGLWNKSVELTAPGRQKI